MTAGCSGPRVAEAPRPAITDAPAPTVTEAPPTTVAATPADSPTVVAPTTFRPAEFPIPFEVTLPPGWLAAEDLSSSVTGFATCRAEWGCTRAIPPVAPGGISVSVIALDHLEGVADPENPRGSPAPPPDSLEEWLRTLDFITVGQTTAREFAGGDATQIEFTVDTIPPGGQTVPVFFLAPDGAHLSFEQGTRIRAIQRDQSGKRLVVLIIALDIDFDERVREAEHILTTMTFL
jgi:hypothetical protein